MDSARIRQFVYAGFWAYITAHLGIYRVYTRVYSVCVINTHVYLTTLHWVPKRSVYFTEYGSFISS